MPHDSDVLSTVSLSHVSYKWHTDIDAPHRPAGAPALVAIQVGCRRFIHAPSNNVASEFAAWRSSHPSVGRFSPFPSASRESVMNALSRRTVARYLQVMTGRGPTAPTVTHLRCCRDGSLCRLQTASLSGLSKHPEPAASRSCMSRARGKGARTATTGPRAREPPGFFVSGRCRSSHLVHPSSSISNLLNVAISLHVLPSIYCWCLT